MDNANAAPQISWSNLNTWSMSEYGSYYSQYDSSDHDNFNDDQDNSPNSSIHQQPSDDLYDPSASAILERVTSDPTARARMEESVEEVAASIVARGAAGALLDAPLRDVMGQVNTFIRITAIT